MYFFKKNLFISLVIFSASAFSDSESASDLEDYPAIKEAENILKEIEQDKKDILNIVNDIRNLLPEKEQENIWEKWLSLKTKSRILYNQGNYIEAIKLAEETLNFAYKNYNKNHINILLTIADLEAYYQSQGYYKKAEELLKKGNVHQLLNTDNLGEKPRHTLTIMHNLAVLYQSQGHYQLAEQYLKNVLRLRKKLLGEKNPDTLASIMSLAATYESQGRYQLAENLYHQVNKELNFNHPYKLALRNNLADIYITQGRYNLAEQYLEKNLKLSKEIKGEDHPETLSSMINLAYLYQKQERYKLAEDLYKEAFELAKSILNEKHPITLTILNNLAVFYSTQGNKDLEEHYINKSLKLRKQVLGEAHPETIVSMYNLASFYKDQDNYHLAEPLYKKTLELFEQVLGKKHPKTLTNINALAKLYQSNEKWDEATQAWKQSLLLTNQILEQLLWRAGDKTRHAYIKQQRPYKNNYLSFYVSRNNPKEALYFSLSQKGLLLYISSQINSLSKSITDSKTQKLAKTFKERKQQLANLVFSNTTNQQYIKNLEEEINILEMQLSQKVSILNRGKIKVTPEKVLEKLNPEQTLIDFLIYNEIDLKTQKYKTEQIIGLIANKEHDIKIVKLGEMYPIRELIKKYRNKEEIKLDGELNNKERIEPIAKELYKALWQPLQPYLNNKKTAYIVPDGILHLLPFKALQDEDGNYLATKINLIQLNNARDIVLPPLEASNNDSTIFANPQYSQQSNNTDESAQNRTIDRSRDKLYFKHLEYTQEEGNYLNTLMQQNNMPAILYDKENATEERINTLRKPRILHLATHAFFLEDTKIEANDNTPKFIDNPLTRSGLALSYANEGVKGKQKDDNDGILTALEVLSLELEGTELVTLSACETAVGDIKIGEGVYSLNRAFQEAGAKAVLSTLWLVDDQGTSEFMQKFYNRFLSGTPAQQALQETQIEFINDEKWNHPYYWAGFVMTGIK